jgi:hypothetical protein
MIAPSEPVQRETTEIPAVVRIVLLQAAKYRKAGLINEQMFNSQIERIKREELEPRGLSLLLRELSGGRTRFLIKKDTTGAICDLIDSPAGA